MAVHTIRCFLFFFFFFYSCAYSRVHPAAWKICWYPVEVILGEIQKFSFLFVTFWQEIRAKDMNMSALIRSHVGMLTAVHIVDELAIKYFDFFVVFVSFNSV